MTQLDPFIIYTVKLAMDFKSVETIPRDTIQENLILPDTMARIMTINTFEPRIGGEKVPKLRRDNILSLLYHADEQWINSTIDLSKIISQDQGQIQAAIDDVHRQQRIYLDTLHLLQKSILPNEFHKRLNEPIWFAAQVLNKNCQIRHLEYFTDTIQPLASKVHDSIEKIRLVTRRLLHKQQSYKQQQQQQQQQQQDSFFSSFFSSFSSSNISYKENNFYHTEQNQDLLQRLEPHLISLYYHWTTFEKALYECYVHTVFGKSHHSNLLWEQQNSTIQQLPNQLFNDQFTQLLPITLERAINLRIIDLQAIQSLEPIAFVAIPRLAILAGVTWLAHLTGWRTDLSSLPIWIKPHTETLNRISSALEKLEFQLLKNQSEDAHHSFVQRYQTLEQILVSGRPMQEDDNNTACQQLEKSIFLDICIIADSVLSSHSTQAFTIVLSHLFRHFGQQYDILFEESEDAIPLEQTVMDLAI